MLRIYYIKYLFIYILYLVYYTRNETCIDKCIQHKQKKVELVLFDTMNQFIALTYTQKKFLFFVCMTVYIFLRVIVYIIYKMRLREKMIIKDVQPVSQ